MDFEFDLARPEDDPALRRLLADNPMPGRLTIAFEREPNYFLGCGTMGRSWQIVVARHKASGEIAGAMCRGIRPHFVNGQPVDIGYIGQIRIAEKYRSLWLLQRGLHFFRQLHADGRAPVYWGVISDENAVARGVLVERHRKNFPAAYRLARLHTLGILLRRPLKPLPFAGTIEPGSAETLPEIVAFLRREGARRQLFPAYDEQDFNGGPATLGFDLCDFLVARQEGAIRGVLGLWDQDSYKQSVVRGYDRSLHLLRPFYNLGARLLGMAALPAIGEPLHYAYASFICVAEDDRPTFAALLRGAYNLAAKRRYANLMIGLAENDPLLPEALRYAHISYFSQLFVGYWPEEAGDFYERLDGRTPYIEIAML